jgi:hypothetical protein
MIELIFAIVIMGLVLMSAPMMITTATKSSMTAFTQESIAIAATHTHALMTYAWDEQNTQSGQNGILETNSSNAALNARAALDATAGAKRYKQVGVSASDPSTFGYQNDTEPVSGAHETITDDVDDFDGRNIVLTVANNTGTQSSDRGDYIDQNITIATSVAYANDTGSSSDFSSCTHSGAGCAYSNPSTAGISGTTNVKFITTTLTTNADTQVDAIDNKKIVLKAFMCNIGMANPRTKGSI